MQLAPRAGCSATAEGLAKWLEFPEISGVIRGTRAGKMLIYRYLTGDDDSAFCHKVTKALAEGWVLHGGTSYAYDAAAKKMRCGQAVTKTVADQPYDPERKLVDYR